MDIFELLNNKFDLCKQIYELNILMFQEQKSFSDKYNYSCSFSEIFNDNLLRHWKYAYGRIKLSDLIRDLGLAFNDINYAIRPIDEKSAIKSLQLNYNMLMHAYENKHNLKGNINDTENFFKICFGKITYILDKIGMKAIKHEDENYFIIVPRDEQVHTIAQHTDKDTAFLLYEYTSPLNKGEYKRKREILKLLANKIEPMSKTYRVKYSSGLGFEIFKDLDLILNNFEIRHPNLDSSIEKNYKEPLTKYTAQEWEEIYDIAYKMMLQAFAIDNFNNIYAKKIQTHKQKIGLDK